MGVVGDRLRKKMIMTMMTHIMCIRSKKVKLRYVELLYVGQSRVNESSFFSVTYRRFFFGRSLFIFHFAFPMHSSSEIDMLSPREEQKTRRLFKFKMDADYRTRRRMHCAAIRSI